MDYGTVATALAPGILFGYAIEQAGFGSPRKLAAQFSFTDWAVFKTMFTAVLVAAVGILLLQSEDLFDSRSFYVPEPLLVATALGGALIGAGMAVGGYCPGTSVVGVMSGRVDGLVFVCGMLLGIAGFSAVYDSAVVQEVMHAAPASAKTLPQLFDVSPWVVVAAMAVVAVAGSLLGARMERGSKGVYTAHDIVTDREAK